MATGRAVLRAPPPGPSSLYRSIPWRVGIQLARVFPERLCGSLSRGLACVYGALARHRREVVVRNLMPPLNHERAAAARKAGALFRQFGQKLADLWRYEAGLPIGHLLGASSGWEHFAAAQARRRGVLLLTIHLGNWEFGGPWLTGRGVALQVLTLPEPGRGFTQMRRAARARWNIRTLVVGEDPFAFVEVIRRLEAGATVALLMDRPVASAAARVELFGQGFAASLAAAELARASGCALVPVYLPRVGRSYEARVLPPVDYDRSSLREREARQQLTQRIMSVFEPVIRERLDQWFHFVPLWD